MRWKIKKKHLSGRKIHSEWHKKVTKFYTTWGNVSVFFINIIILIKCSFAFCCLLWQYIFLLLWFLWGLDFLVFLMVINLTAYLPELARTKAAPCAKLTCGALKHNCCTNKIDIVTDITSHNLLLPTIFHNKAEQETSRFIGKLLFISIFF